MLADGSVCMCVGGTAGGLLTHWNLNRPAGCIGLLVGYFVRCSTGRFVFLSSPCTPAMRTPNHQSYTVVAPPAIQSSTRPNDHLNHTHTHQFVVGWLRQSIGRLRSCLLIPPSGLVDWFAGCWLCGVLFGAVRFPCVCCVCTHWSRCSSIP